MYIFILSFSLTCFCSTVEGGSVRQFVRGSQVHKQVLLFFKGIMATQIPAMRIFTLRGVHKLQPQGKFGSLPPFIQQ